MTLATSSKTVFGDLHLALERRKQKIFADDTSECQLILRDAHGMEIMRFALPQTFADEIRTTSADLELFMSLDGSISIVAPESQRVAISAAIGLDELIGRDISPVMLEDEPHARQLLTRLRERLSAAMSSVDAAISSLHG